MTGVGGRNVTGVHGGIMRNNKSVTGGTWKCNE